MEGGREMEGEAETEEAAEPWWRQKPLLAGCALCMLLMLFSPEKGEAPQPPALATQANLYWCTCDSVSPEIRSSL